MYALFLPCVTVLTLFQPIKSFAPSSHTRSFRETRFRTQSSDSNDDELFDPLLSPHAYPNGVDFGSKSSSPSPAPSVDDWTPFKMNSVKDDFRGASDDDYKVQKSTFTRNWSSSINSVEDNDNGYDTSESKRENEESAELFDPLLSPHCYPKGTSSGPIQSLSNNNVKVQNRVGVLLIDHGSRREASNTHLESLAAFYQERAPLNYVVRAAHMEIAEPSIKDGIKTLIYEEKVDKIVCHPYFLSPGRHVIEDIPQLISEAIEDLDIASMNDFEILTTNHVGSNMDMMVNLIGTIVDEAIGVDTVLEDSGFVAKDPSSLGGFFGQIQQMLEEEL